MGLQTVLESDLYYRVGQCRGPRDTPSTSCWTPQRHCSPPTGPRRSPCRPLRARPARRAARCTTGSRRARRCAASSGCVPRSASMPGSPPRCPRRAIRSSGASPAARYTVQWCRDHPVEAQVLLAGADALCLGRLARRAVGSTQESAPQTAPAVGGRARRRRPGDRCGGRHPVRDRASPFTDEPGDSGKRGRDCGGLRANSYSA